MPTYSVDTILLKSFYTPLIATIPDNIHNAFLDPIVLSCQTGANVLPLQMLMAHVMLHNPETRTRNPPYAEIQYGIILALLFNNKQFYKKGRYYNA